MGTEAVEKKEKIAKLNAEIAKLESGKGAIQDWVKKKEAEMNKLSAEKKSAIESIQVERNKLKDEREQTLKEANSLAKDIKNFNKERQDMNSEKADLDSKIKALEAKKKELSETKKSVENRISIASEKEARINAFVESIIALKE